MMTVFILRFWNRYFVQWNCVIQNCRIFTPKFVYLNETDSFKILKHVKNYHFSRNIYIPSKLNFNNENNIVNSTEISEQLFNAVCEETLESLTEFFEDLLDRNINLKSADASYNNGVLTINLGSHGTYVINRQGPNKQIWLSSPISGPKRYDYDNHQGIWLYKHDKRSLHELLQSELRQIFNEQIDLSKCAHSIK